MNSNARRIVTSCFVLSVAAAGLAIPTPAHGQGRAQLPAAQQRIAEGTQQWGEDGWRYVVQGGRWLRTGYFRQFPDRRNYPNVFDIFQNGRFQQRVGGSAPVTGQVRRPNRQPSAEEARLEQLVKDMNKQIAIAKRQPTWATPPLVAGSAGTIGGFSLNTPNVNPLTVDSRAADAVRNQPGPLGQALGIADGINTQFINRGAAIRLADGTVYYVR